MKFQPGKLVTKAEFCDLFGISRYFCDKLIAEGMPVENRASGRGTDTTLRVGSCAAWMIAKATGEQEQSTVDSDRERGLLYKAQRERAEIDNAVARGELVRMRDVEATDAVVFTALRDRIRAVTSIVPQLRQQAMEGKELAMTATLEAALVDAIEGVVKRAAAAH